MTCVSSLTLSFFSEFASVSSFESLSNFWTVPESCAVLALVLVSPDVDADALDEPVPMSLDRLEPVPMESLPVRELLESFEPAVPLDAELEPVAGLAPIDSLPLFVALLESFVSVEAEVSLEVEPEPVPPSEPLEEPIDPRLESSVVLVEPVVESGLVAPLFGSVAVEPVLVEAPARSSDVCPLAVEPPVVLCAWAGAATSSPASPSPVNVVPHPKSFIRAPSLCAVVVLGSHAERPWPRAGSLYGRDRCPGRTGSPPVRRGHPRGGSLRDRPVPGRPVRPACYLNG
jgi:hypothetical protein